MRKINEVLDEASERLSIAWGVLVNFDCTSILDCNDFPILHEGRCAAALLGEMYARADKRSKEAAK